jgi:hypothetical protein
MAYEAGAGSGTSEQRCLSPDQETGPTEGAVTGGRPPTGFTNVHRSCQRDHGAARRD